MAQSVKVAVIPAAGLGTRFLPATKAIPKEMLPIVDVPTIQLIVEEAVASGIEKIVLVTSRGKSSILDHFDMIPELEEKLDKDGKKELADLVRYTSTLAKVVAVRQGVPRGLGHAVLCAREVIGNEPFAVMLGDDLVDSKVPCLKQMIDVYQKYQKSVVALLPVAERDVPKFGICGGPQISNRIYDLNQMVEKPKLADAPSRLSIVGRYVLQPDIFSILENQAPGRGGEIQLTDGMSTLMKKNGFIGYEFEGNRFDAGDKFGFLQANIHYALKRQDVAPHLREYITQLAKTFQ